MEGLVLGLSPVWRTARGRQHSEGEADGAGQREAEGDEEPHGARLRGVVRGACVRGVLMAWHGVCMACAWRVHGGTPARSHPGRRY